MFNWQTLILMLAVTHISYNIFLLSPCLKLRKIFAGTAEMMKAYILFDEKQKYGNRSCEKHMQ